MASFDTLKETIFVPMQAIFRPPMGSKPEDIPVMLKAYTKALEPFDAFILRGGWDLLIEQYEGASWPKPAVIIKACREFSARPNEELRNKRQQEYDKLDRQAIEHVMNGPEGRGAADAGYLTDLLRIMEEERRWPTEDDHLGLISRVEDAEREVVKLKSRGGVYDGSLLRMWNTMVEREIKLCKRYGHKSKYNSVDMNT